MKPPAFDYETPDSVEAATALLAAHEGDAKVLAGGQSLVPMLNFRLLAPAVLVDITRIAALSGIEETATGLRIGALTRHYAVETSDAIRAKFPVISAAMPYVAHLAIRNRGTTGGSLSHADPAAEWPTLAVLLDAVFTIAGPDGAREVAAKDFFVGALTPDLEDAEILTAIDLPALPANTGWDFREVARRSGDFGMAGVAVTLTRDGGTVREARIALLGLDDTPVRATAAEAMMTGQAFDTDLAAAAAGAARDGAEPNTDLHASADYRRHLAEVLTRRALAAAWDRAGEHAA